MKTPMINAKRIVLAAALAACGGMSMSANAILQFGNLLQIDVGNIGYDSPPFVGTGDANSRTGSFEQMGFGAFLATSVYDLSEAGETGTAADLAGAFFDSNDPAVLAALGIPASGTALDGSTTVNLTVPTSPAQMDIDELAPLVPPLSSDNEGFLGSWELLVAYTLAGELDLNTGPDYQTGTVDIYFHERLDVTGAAGLDTYKVLTLSLTGFNLQVANLELFFDVTYALPGFLWVDKNGTWVDASTTDVTARLATNVDPPIPTLNQLLELDPADAAFTGYDVVAVRQNELNGGIEYRVPEPASLGLLGLGLLGLGATRRRLQGK